MDGVIDQVEGRNKTLVPHKKEGNLRAYPWDIVLDSVACEQSKVYQAPERALESYQVALWYDEPHETLVG